MRLTMSLPEERTVDFGTFLRQAREKRGLTLQQVAIATKISARVLEALERNDPSKLPGGIFSRAFVRSYAKEVGLDPEAAVASFVAAFPDDSGAGDVPVATTAEEAESYESHRRVATTVVKLLGASAIVVILGLIVYTAWQRTRGPAAPQAGQRPAVAEPAPQVAVPAPAPVEATPAVPAGGSAAEQTAANVPGGDGRAASAASMPAAPAASPAAAGAAAAPLVVGLSATEACWLSVSVDGTRLPSRTLGAGERVEFPVNQSITMTVGNAGALDMSLNGKPAKALGGAGQVVTTTIAADAFTSYLR
jgi:cytoskeleton protein RodZ